MDNKHSNIIFETIEYLYCRLIYPVINILQWLFDSIVKLVDVVNSYILPSKHAQKTANLVQIIIDNNNSSRNCLWASKALGTMGTATHAIPQLLTLLKHSNPEIRTCAVRALGYMGNSAKSALPEVLKLFKDPDSKVRYNSVEVLGKIGELTQLEIQCLFPLLQDSDSMVRMMTIHILGYREEFANLTIPQLIPLLVVKKDDVNTRVHAHLALKRLGWEKTAS
jgi:HEAT repeat protein